MLTLKALRAIEESEYVVGYKTYVERICSLTNRKKIITTKMREELERVRKAVELAKESTVSLVTGGDPSIYGILPLVVEYLLKNNIEVEVEVIPGVSALNAASSLLGSPISGDYAVISLSDLLVPWNVIEGRLIYALMGDFVVAIYNPSSRKRKSNLRKAIELIIRYRGDVYVGVVKNAFRESQQVRILKASEILKNPDFVDMNTILIVSNSGTIVKDGVMLTPRGYSSKYPEINNKVKMGARTREAIEIARKSSEILKSIYPGDDLKAEIVRRCIAATGDVSVKDAICFNGDVNRGIEALKGDCRIIVDVGMLKAGLRKNAIAAVDFAEGSDETRAASGLKKIAHLIEGSLVGIGNSPSAAIALCKMAKQYKPSFVVATPVGFVNAAESKEMIKKLDVPSITTAGTRGGSNICAAIINCLIEYAERPN
jgi:precorrin-3B C17-methyltransferase